MNFYSVLTDKAVHCLFFVENCSCIFRNFGVCTPLRRIFIAQIRHKSLKFCPIVIRKLFSRLFIDSS